MIAVAATLFEGKVIRHVCYRHPFNMAIPDFGLPGVEFAFEAIKFDLGHSIVFIANNASAIVLASTLEGIGPLDWSTAYWYVRDSCNWQPLRGVRISSVSCVDEAGRIISLTMAFGDGTSVTIVPSTPDAASPFPWPSGSSLLKVTRLSLLTPRGV